MIQDSISKLISFCERQNFSGYDPYDTLNSVFPFRKFGKYSSAVAIQLQKRNPINIRPLLGIQKGYNPKAMGLFLKAYSLLYKSTGQEDLLETANLLFNWLHENYTKGYSGMCWGYNFDWASPGNFLKAYTPSVVVTSFVVDGIYEYNKISNNPLAEKAILSAAEYIRKDIPKSELEGGISFSYTHLSSGACYNASLLATEVLAKANLIQSNSADVFKIKKAIHFVLSKQKNDGSWNYSLNIENKTERKQIDFHQGFILVSLSNLNNMLKSPREDVYLAINKGLEYYRKNQFFNNGRSLWRIPRKWPVDIHNQSQGIITFSKLKQYNPDYLDFANTIASWTIENMQSGNGYFFYRKTPFITNKIPYMRWAQAWMMLALTELLINEQ